MPDASCHLNSSLILQVDAKHPSGVLGNAVVAKKVQHPPSFNLCLSTPASPSAYHSRSSCAEIPEGTFEGHAIVYANANPDDNTNANPNDNTNATTNAIANTCNQLNTTNPQTGRDLAVSGLLVLLCIECCVKSESFGKRFSSETNMWEFISL